MSDFRTEPFGFYHGASWMMPDGTMHIVPGFHDEWIQSHPGLAGDCHSVLELVTRKKWISIVVFQGKYVEICVKNRHDADSLALLYRFLVINSGAWETVLIMTLEDDGFIQVHHSDFKSPETFAALLSPGNVTPS